jgi:hypothetical protein
MTESIMMSGYPVLENVSQILSESHDIFLQKPACVQLLLGTVRKIMDRKVQVKLETTGEAR